MKTNLVLIGLTGSGKTTIGKKFSKQSGLPFVDIDEYIEQKNGKTIPQLFQVSEEYFRNLETEACKIIASEYSHSVISCGGGVVLRKENIEALKKTGWIIFIDRSVSKIAQNIKVEHRPLLKDNIEKLYQLAEERMDAYQESSDFIVKNNSSIKKTIEQIQAFISDKHILLDKEQEDETIYH
jgi:shikimate kinase